MSKSRKASAPRSKSGRSSGKSQGGRRTSRVVQRRAKTGPVSLAAECLINDAPALKQELAARIADRAPVVLDISAIRRIDTAALQVIGAFVRERTSRGLATTWHGVAPAFTAAASLLGLLGLLQIRAAAAASDPALP